ncbi:SAV_915 family protein [Mycolicibacterium neworleansense]|uniref:SAV_915 family protein n=1 Tax=Mycolicibacterium neworleansense TaxID=146018 RepID=UPI0027E263B3|nr:SAV_915 family protein [Mycolicibacterium neworleansense]
MDDSEPTNRGAASANERGRPTGHVPVDSQLANPTHNRWDPPVGVTSTQAVPVQQARNSFPHPTRDRVETPPVHHHVEGADGACEKRSDSKPIPRDFPPVVYLPCAESVDDPNDARIDMRETRDGRTALLAYSALDRLHECCGEDQAWIVVPTAILSQLQKLHPFQLLMLDIEIPIEQRRGQK